MSTLYDEVNKLPVRVIDWHSPCCPCYGRFILELDKIQVIPCDLDHFWWCAVICNEVTRRKERERNKTERTSFKPVLDDYLLWKDDLVFMRPMNIQCSAGAPSAQQAMQDWEFVGVHAASDRDVPALWSSEPELLADYVQGKRCREFTIKNWKEDTIYNGIHFIEGDGRDIGSLFWPEEFIGTSGLTAENFESIMGVPPNPERMKVLYGEHSLTSENR
jgi:hypothetical protein